ncbi:unnamed protein product [Prunus armeniaca]|uniref:Uncharacterized protein n=1 Tax=Prunus armeniaca TaxID=36596 RepID=A0A6J5XE15_PRUAR|nr:unnamed protein product [Prunus armeniaca]CAB4312090.1 unnamed protein product [Prunus armeniaca]
MHEENEYHSIAITRVAIRGNVLTSIYQAIKAQDFKGVIIKQVIAGVGEIIERGSVLPECDKEWGIGICNGLETVYPWSQ